MKHFLSLLFVVALILSSTTNASVYAIGDGNFDGGGGGMGDGTSENVWSPNNEGVRVTVVRASDHVPVTAPLDLTNKKPNNIKIHFGKVSKISYSHGRNLLPMTTAYSYLNPKEPIPQIISTNKGNENIKEIKKYFCSEYTIMRISQATGIDYETLIGGNYKILIEPIAYFKFQGIIMAMTATEAALYTEMTKGVLRSKMGSLTSQNLPLAMFLETADLGYPAWKGSTSGYRSTAEIKSSLGLGVVRFSENEDVPSLGTYDYEYHTDTDVITAVTISGGQSDPNNTTSVNFKILGKTYTVKNVYYPKGDSQLVWVKWHTPKNEENILITVSVSGNGKADKSIINCKITDLNKNTPPNPVADDRNVNFKYVSIPNKQQKGSASWTVWRPWWNAHWIWESNWVWKNRECTSYCPKNCKGGHGKWVDCGKWIGKGWWEFSLNHYSASVTASMKVEPDSKNPTARGQYMKSGYGFRETVLTSLQSNQPSATTHVQNVVTYFPEFQYKQYWRLLDRVGTEKFEFQENKYSTYNNRTHFTPIWVPNGNYTPYTCVIDCWTPCGMLSVNLTDTLIIHGSLWDDWHCAPKEP